MKMMVKVLYSSETWTLRKRILKGWMPLRLDLAMNDDFLDAGVFSRST